MYFKNYTHRFFLYLFVFVLLIGIAIRISVASGDISESGDAGERYVPIAKNLSRGNGFSRSAAPPYAAEGFDMPVYPYFVAAVYTVSGESNRAVVIVQLIIEASTIWLIFLTAGALGLSVRQKYIAAAIAIIFPVQAIFAGYILTETLAVFLITAAIYFIARSKQLKFIALAGVFTALGVLTRPDLIIIAGLLALCIPVYFILTGSKALAARATISFAAALLILPGIWGLRNYYEFNSFRPLGMTVEQTKLGYAKWLNTWANHPKYLEGYWWHVRDEKMQTALPDDVYVFERERAEKGLRLIQQQKNC